MSNGKGDRPRNMSETFKQNFDRINWRTENPRQLPREILRDKKRGRVVSSYGGSL